MDRWSGIMKVPLHPFSRARYQVAASLCLNSSSRSLGVPSTNAIFFSGDRVQGTGNPVIEKLSDLKTVADILVSKLGDSTNAWVIEASNFNGPFAVYKDFIPSVTQWGEPKSYDAAGFSASTSIALLLSNCLKEARTLISEKLQEPYQDEECLCPPKTILFGFSKGGTVLNQLMTELAFSELSSVKTHSQVNKSLINEELVNRQSTIVPISQDILLDSIDEIHFVDVGLNTAGAYLTDPNVIKKISERALQGGSRIRFVLHGTPRQWCDPMRVWVREEKDALVKLLQSEAESSGGNLSVCERLYFADMPPNLQMHFEVIESMNLSK